MGKTMVLVLWMYLFYQGQFFFHWKGTIWLSMGMYEWKLNECFLNYTPLLRIRVPSIHTDTSK